ncbi:MAG: PTS system mannose/fructose/sorbose family transporter subunit IID [Elusimicrobia bacterium]|nr:PTS system mannose/fructose/sorbose family transporter subunit IID [Elusimicrobiota bacterium]
MKNCNIIRTFFRSFLFQAVWNFERMQNVGFLYSIMPCLKEIYGTDENRLKNAAMRHFDFFNTHPYIANAIIAITLILENEKTVDDETKSQQIKSLKLHIGGPIAAIGDTFFWARLRPLCGLLAAGYVFLQCKTLKQVQGFTSCHFLVPLAFIFLYNIPHVFFRFFGFWLGLKCKTDVVKIISNVRLQKISEIIRIIGIFICIFVLVAYIITSAEYRFVGALVFLVSFILLKKNVSVISIFWGLVIGCVGIGFLM